MGSGLWAMGCAGKLLSLVPRAQVVNAHSQRPMALYSFGPSLFRRPYGNEETIIPEIQRAEIRQGSQQAGGERHASAEARHAQERQGRAGWQGEEPGAGDRDRLVGGPEEGGEGACQEERPAEEGLAQAVLRGLAQSAVSAPY